jgi:proline iminopeptidase
VYATIAGARLFFDVDGEALSVDGTGMRHKPVIVALHGGPGSDHTVFKPALGELTCDAQVVYLDQRGCGRSVPTDRVATDLDTAVRDLAEFLDHLGLDRVVLLGQSYGGMLALSHAVRHPERVAGLVLLSAAASYEFIDHGRDTIARTGTRRERELADRLWTGTFTDNAQVREYFECLGPRYSRTYGTTAAQRPATIRSAAALNAGFGGYLRTYDVRSDLPRIRARTLVIAGRHDWLCPPRFSAEIAASISDARLAVFEDSAHHVMDDEPDRFVAELRTFVRAEVGAA